MDYFEWQVKAATDAEFRQRLIDDPKSVLAECGVEIPAGTAVRVAESTPEELVVTIPPLLPDSAELDEDALASTAAGSTPAPRCRRRVGHPWTLWFSEHWDRPKGPNSQVTVLRSAQQRRRLR